MPGLGGVVAWPDHDFDILVECSQKRHQALDEKQIQAVGTVAKGRQIAPVTTPAPKAKACPKTGL